MITHAVWTSVMLSPRLKRLCILLTIGFALAAVYTVTVPGAKVSALHGSNIVQNGNWDSAGRQIGNSIPASVDTSAEFTAWIKALLHNTANAGTPGSDYNKYGAAFIVETMMHGQVNYAANATLVNAALADYDTWSQYVMQYGSASKVQWSVSATIPSGSINSLHVCVEGAGGYCWNRATYFNNNYNGGGYDAKKFQFYTITAPEPSTLIIFTNPDGTTYKLRRECANAIGSVKPLKDYGWNLGGQTTSDKASIFANETATITSKIKNSGPVAATSFDWYVRYCWDACPGGYASGYTQRKTGTATNFAATNTYATFDTWAYTPGPSETHTKICVWIAYSDSTGVNDPEGHGAMTCVTIKPLSPACGGATFNPGTIDPADPYSVTGLVNVAGGLPGAQAVSANSSFYIAISGPGVGINNANVTPVQVGANGTMGTLQATLNAPATNNAGNYTVNYGITGPVSSINCSDTFAVSYTPYFIVRGGDVAAGPGFGAACQTLNSDIDAKNLGSSKGYYGASSELAAFSLGTMRGFATNTTLNMGSGLGGSTNGLAALQPSGLAFANFGATSTTWGTTYGKDPADDPAGNSSWCAPDYYGTADDAAAPEDLGANTLDQGKLNSLGSGKTYRATGTVTLRDLKFGGSAPSHITLIVSGDVIITDNILYNPYAYSSATANIGDVPHFELLVQGGNIYVGESVTTLHGFYHASQAGSIGGTMYTCGSGQKYLTDVASGPSNSLFDANYYNRCKLPLSVYGSIAAHDLRLNRTGGSWKATLSVPNIPAEQITYTPELWMGAYAASQGGAVQPFDAITSLPPIF